LRRRNGAQHAGDDRSGVIPSRVDQLVDLSGLGERELQRMFKRNVGTSPTQVLRRQRLQGAAVRLDRGDVPSLADLAHELGYADQVHSGARPLAGGPSDSDPDVAHGPIVAGGRGARRSPPLWTQPPNIASTSVQNPS